MHPWAGIRYKLPGKCLRKRPGPLRSDTASRPPSQRRQLALDSNGHLRLALALGGLRVERKIVLTTAIGAVLGAGVGVVIGNIIVGIVYGVAFGAAVGAILDRRIRNRPIV